MKEFTFKIYTNQNSLCGEMSVYATDYDEAVDTVEYSIAADSGITVDEVKDLYYVDLVNDK